MAKDTEENLKKRGMRIRAIRKSKHITAIELAGYLNISRSSYTRIEDGERDMRCFEAIEIAKYLNVPINKIIGVEAPRLVSDKIKKFALSSGFEAREINPRLFNFAVTVVQDLHHV